MDDGQRRWTGSGRRLVGARALCVELAATTDSACQKVAVAAAQLRLVRAARPAEPLRIGVMALSTLDSRPYNFLLRSIACCCATQTRWGRVSRPHRLPCSGLPTDPTSRLQLRCKPKLWTLPTLLHLLLPQTLLSSLMTKSVANTSKVYLLTSSLYSLLLILHRQETRFWSVCRRLLCSPRLGPHPARRHQEDQGWPRSPRMGHITRFPARNQIPSGAVTSQHNPPVLRLLHKEPKPQPRPRTTAPG